MSNSNKRAPPMKRAPPSKRARGKSPQGITNAQTQKAIVNAQMLEANAQMRDAVANARTQGASVAAPTGMAHGILKSNLLRFGMQKLRNIRQKCLPGQKCKPRSTKNTIAGEIITLLNNTPNPALIREITADLENYVATHTPTPSEKALVNQIRREGARANPGRGGTPAGVGGVSMTMSLRNSKAVIGDIVDLGLKVGPVEVTPDDILKAANYVMENAVPVIRSARNPKREFAKWTAIQITKIGALVATLTATTNLEQKEIIWAEIYDIIVKIYEKISLLWTVLKTGKWFIDRGNDAASLFGRAFEPLRRAQPTLNLSPIPPQYSANAAHRIGMPKRPGMSFETSRRLIVDSAVHAYRMNALLTCLGAILVVLILIGVIHPPFRTWAKKKARNTKSAIFSGLRRTRNRVTKVARSGASAMASGAYRIAPYLESLARIQRIREQRVQAQRRL